MSSLDKLKRLSTRNSGFIVSQTFSDQRATYFYKTKEGHPWVFESAESALTHLAQDLASLIATKGTHSTIAEQVANFQLIEYRSHKRYQITLNAELNALKAFDEISGTVLEELAFPPAKSFRLAISQEDLSDHTR